MADGSMKRYLVKSKLGIGRDFSVFDDEAATHKVYFIDAKAGLGTKAEIRDADDNILYMAKSRIINIPRRMEFFAPDGTLAAKIKARFSPIKSRLTMELADGKVWELQGNFIGKSYQVSDGEKLIIDINQKWMTVRDKYYVEIDADVDVALALGLIWAVDVWREDKNN